MKIWQFQYDSIFNQNNTVGIQRTVIPMYIFLYYRSGVMIYISIERKYNGLSKTVLVASIGPIMTILLQ